MGAVAALCPAGRAGELLDRAGAGSTECRGRVAVEEGGVVAGIALSGFVAGALGTGALLWVAVRPDRRRQGIAALLIRDALGELARDGARLVVAELATDATSAPMAALLERAGFEREGFVADFYREGVGLSLWRRLPG